MLKLKSIPLYYSPESVEDLQAYIKQLPKDDQFLANLIFGLTWNCCARLTDPDQTGGDDNG